MLCGTGLYCTALIKPGVIHVASRNVATHAITINAEQSDVMACRQTGVALLASSSVQDCMDLGAVAHLAAIRGHVPFLHFFDGFRTSHEIQNVEYLDYEDIKNIVDWDELAKTPSTLNTLFYAQQDITMIHTSRAAKPATLSMTHCPM